MRKIKKAKMKEDKMKLLQNPSHPHLKIRSVKESFASLFEKKKDIIFLFKNNELVYETIVS